MKREGRFNELLVFGEGDQRWVCPDPTHRQVSSGALASALRALVALPDGVSKLKQIRKGLADERKARTSP